MPTNKNAQLRYLILDRCFSDFRHKYEIGDLLEKVNQALCELYGTSVGLRQIRDDIKYMRDRLTYDAPIKAYPHDGRRCYYRYERADFSIFNNELTVDEVACLRSTIHMLGRFRGVPSNVWLEEVISSLEYRFGVKPHRENVVAFEQNERLKGLQFLGQLIDHTINHQPLSILYRTFSGQESEAVFHPYYLKQFNNRWFLFGLQEGYEQGAVTNKALDRIVRFAPAQVPFIPNRHINFDTYFDHIVGVTIPQEHPLAEEVVLKFHPARFPYVVNKPIHSSQVTLDAQACTIELTVRPNKELEAAILSFGAQVEVLRPLWLRQQMINNLRKLMAVYASVQNGSTDEP